MDLAVEGQVATTSQYLKDYTWITYYCGRRKKYFKRKVLVDRDLEIQRKLNGAVFNLIHDNKPNGRQSDGLVLQRVGSRWTSGGDESGSIPRYLFGEEYFRARRADPANLWDLRRSAFVPVKSHGTS